MKNQRVLMMTLAVAITLLVVILAGWGDKSVNAQNAGTIVPRLPVCTNGTASGTYGYQMAGQIVGVGPFLVNGLFTHYVNGTMDADVQLLVGNQSFPAAGTGGTFTTKRDCTGSGKFRVDALNLEVTYNFIATDGGNQIELLNTNPGIVLHGVARRIAFPGTLPKCSNVTIVGNYGGRLEGSIPGVPAIALAGKYTHSVDQNFNGLLGGSDTMSLMGQFVPRVIQGNYQMGSNCRGSGTYTDSLGTTVNYVMTAVDNGNRIFLMGTDPNTAVWGTVTRIR